MTLPPANAESDTSQSFAPLPMLKDPNHAVTVQGAAGFETAVYPSPVNSNPVLNKSILGTLNFQLENQSSPYRSQIDVTVGKFVDWGESYLDVHEAFMSYSHLDSDSEITVGRRLEFWSELDQNWRLGEWQPIQNEDPLRPIPEGLTGFFAEKKWSDWNLLAFASPFFLPNTGPSVQERDGALVSQSRWFNQPAQTAQILGVSTNLQYNLSVPPINTIVGNPGGGVRLLWGNRHEGAWSSLNYGYKPINALQLKYDASLLSSGTQGSVDVAPVVAYHHLYGADAGWSDGETHASVSILDDEPIGQNPAFDPNTDFWQQQPASMKQVALHGDKHFGVSPFVEPVAIDLDYLRVWESTTFDVDSQGIPRTAVFPYRSMFTNALSVKASIASVLQGRRLISSFRALRDFDQSGNLFQTHFSWLYSAQWHFTAGVDLISPDDPSAANTDGRFLNEFRSNDRVYGGFQYAF